MELLLSKEQKKILYVLINTSGKIIYTDAASYITKDIFDLVDKNEILKLSMYEGVTYNIASKLEGYKSCIATVLGTGIGKYIRLCFASDELCLENTDKIKDIVNAFIDNTGKIKCVDIDLFISKIIKSLSKEGIRIKKGECIKAEFPLSLKSVKILIVDAVAILSDISSRDEVTVNADITDYGVRISLHAEVKSGKIVRGVVDFCKSYTSSSNNIMYLNTICGREGIELDMSMENGACKISFTYPLGEIQEFDVLEKDKYDEEDAIKGIINAFFNK